MPRRLIADSELKILIFNFLQSSLRSTQPPSEAYLARALLVLTKHLGPIAKIVLKRAAQQAPSEAAFVQAVIAACPELDEAQLRRDLTSR